MPTDRAIDQHEYRCPCCKRYLTLGFSPAEYRRSTGSSVCCPHDGEVLVYKGLRGEVR